MDRKPVLCKGLLKKQSVPQRSLFRLRQERKSSMHLLFLTNYNILYRLFFIKQSIWCGVPFQIFIMADIWDYLKNLFTKSEGSPSSQPFLHEVIVRSAEEKADYEHWKNTLVRRRLMDWLNDQYAIFRVLPQDIDEAIDFLNTPSSKGFVIHFYKTNYSRRDVTHLLDYLKEQVLVLDYKIQVSDSRTFNRPNWVENLERHYLKPRPDFEQKDKLSQKFGNITIEIQLRNDEPYHLKFQATTYNDHLFKDAHDFEDLMQAVLI